MNKRWIAAVAALGLVAVLSGCADQKQAESPPPPQAGDVQPPPSDTDTPAPPSEAGHPEAVNRPATKTINLRIEGMEEPFTFHLFSHEAVPFTTYYPKDMLPQVLPGDQSTGVRFIANFGNHKNEDAYLEVSFFPAGTSEDAARSAAREAAASRGLAERQADVPNRYDWSVAEYDFQYKKGDQHLIGTVVLGHHADQYFQVTLHHPEEYAEGIHPRAWQILQEWLWVDTGEGLQ